MLIDAANDHYLIQVVDHATRKENIPDLFFATNPSLVNSGTTAPPLTPDAEHNIVFIDLDTRAAIPKQIRTSRYIYNKADWERMRESLKSYKVPEGSTQEQWDDMEKTIKACISEQIPIKLSKPAKPQPWINRNLLTMINR